MQPDNEEELILGIYRSARNAAEEYRKETSARRFTQNGLDTREEEAKQAYVDYLQSAGLLETEYVTLGTSQSIDCPDIGAVPAEFIRTKETKEPNKIAIKAAIKDGLQANWFSVVEKPFITLK